MRFLRFLSPDLPNDGGGAPEGDAPVVDPPAAQPQGGGNQRAGQFMPTAAIGKLKKEARERGAREATAALDASAKQAGFESHAAMLAFAAEAKRNPQRAQPAAQPTTQARPQGGGGGSSVSKRDYDRVVQENTSLQEQVRTVRKENLRLAKRLRESGRALLDTEAKHELRFEALAAGVKPKLIPAAMALYRESIPAQNDGEEDKAYYARLEKFDGQKFFDSLREAEPNFFGSEPVRSRPADTGNGTVVPQGKAPGADRSQPALEPNPPPGGAPPGKHAADMTPAQMAARLKELGMDPNLAN
jgi:hypothetical protein